MNTTEIWTEKLPTTAGKFLWRKNWQWLAIPREVYYSETRKCLVCWSDRYEQAVPLLNLYGEWLVPPATETPVKNGVFTN